MKCSISPGSSLSAKVPSNGFQSFLSESTIFAIVPIIFWLPVKSTVIFRTLVKSAYHKNNFLICQPKNMLWVLKRIAYAKNYKQEHYIYNFTLKSFVNFAKNYNIRVVSNCQLPMG